MRTCFESSALRVRENESVDQPTASSRCWQRRLPSLRRCGTVAI